MIYVLMGENREKMLSAPFNVADGRGGVSIDVVRVSKVSEMWSIPSLD